MKRRRKVPCTLDHGESMFEGLLYKGRKVVRHRRCREEDSAEVRKEIRVLAKRHLMTHPK